MAQHIKVGDKLPSFTINDHEGMEIEADDLIGSPFVLYFYPRNDTPGCTIEACAFRDNMDIFDQLETLVIGVSPNSASSHDKFIEKHDLNFTLLCDENLALAAKFGATKDKTLGGEKTKGVLRSTFIFDSNGILTWMEQPVSVDGHVERVLDALEKMIIQPKT